MSGSLMDGKTLSQPFCWKIYEMCIMGCNLLIDFMYTRQYCRRDIEPGNILFDFISGRFNGCFFQAMQLHMEDIQISRFSSLVFHTLCRRYITTKGTALCGVLPRTTFRLSRRVFQGSSAKVSKVCYQQCLKDCISSPTSGYMRTMTKDMYMRSPRLLQRAICGAEQHRGLSHKSICSVPQKSCTYAVLQRAISGLLQKDLCRIPHISLYLEFHKDTVCGAPQIGISIVSQVLYFKSHQEQRAVCEVSQRYVCEVPVRALLLQRAVYGAELHKGLPHKCIGAVPQKSCICSSTKWLIADFLKDTTDLRFL